MTCNDALTRTVIPCRAKCASGTTHASAAPRFAAGLPSAPCCDLPPCVATRPQPLFGAPSQVRSAPGAGHRQPTPDAGSLQTHYVPDEIAPGMEEPIHAVLRASGGVIIAEGRTVSALPGGSAGNRNTWTVPHGLFAAVSICPPS